MRSSLLIVRLMRAEAPASRCSSYSERLQPIVASVMESKVSLTLHSGSQLSLHDCEVKVPGHSITGSLRWRWPGMHIPGAACAICFLQSTTALARLSGIMCPDPLARALSPTSIEVSAHDHHWMPDSLARAVVAWRKQMAQAAPRMCIPGHLQHSARRRREWQRSKSLEVQE